VSPVECIDRTDGDGSAAEYVHDMSSVSPSSMNGQSTVAGRTQEPLDDTALARKNDSAYGLQLSIAVCIMDELRESPEMLPSNGSRWTSVLMISRFDGSRSSKAVPNANGMSTLLGVAGWEDNEPESAGDSGECVDGGVIDALDVRNASVVGEEGESGGSESQAAPLGEYSIHDV